MIFKPATSGLLYGTKGVATLVGVSRTTVISWINARKLPAHRGDRGMFYIFEDDVENFAKPLAELRKSKRT